MRDTSLYAARRMGDDGALHAAFGVVLPRIVHSGEASAAAYGERIAGAAAHHAVPNEARDRALTFRRDTVYDVAEEKARVSEERGTRIDAAVRLHERRFAAQDKTMPERLHAPARERAAAFRLREGDADARERGEFVEAAAERRNRRRGLRLPRGDEPSPAPLPAQEVKPDAPHVAEVVCKLGESR